MPHMAETAARFQCPNCEAEYRVVHVEAPPTHDQPLLCLSCRSPLQNREGKFALKYFRMKRAKRAQEVRSASTSPQGQNRKDDRDRLPRPLSAKSRGARKPRAPSLPRQRDNTRRSICWRLALPLLIAGALLLIVEERPRRRIVLVHGT